MGHSDYEESSSGGTVIAVVAVIALLLFGGLVVAGAGTWFFMRSAVREEQIRAVMQAERAETMAERAQAQANAAEMQARVQAAQAEMLARAGQSEAEAAAAFAELEAATDQALNEQAGAAAGRDTSFGVTPPAMQTVEIVINLDQAGEMQVDGQPVDRDALKTILQEAAAPDVQVKTRLRVDPRCTFGGVADVQSICLEAGVSEITFHTTGE